jgi:hypothetical protein
MGQVSGASFRYLSVAMRKNGAMVNRFFSAMFIQVTYKLAAGFIVLLAGLVQGQAAQRGEGICFARKRSRTDASVGMERHPPNKLEACFFKAP